MTIELAIPRLTYTFQKGKHILSDDAEKSLMSHIVLVCSQQHLHDKKKRPYREHQCGAGQIPCESQVRIFSQLQSTRAGINYAYLFFEGLWVFIVVQSQNTFACATSLFHIEKISINACIFQNPHCVRILFILGLYELGLNLKRKSFPFRVSWRPHNDQLSATWPFDSSTLCPFTQDPSTISLFAQHSVHLSGSVTSNFLPLQLAPHPMSL